MADTTQASNNDELAAVKADLSLLKKDLAELLAVMKESSKTRASNLEHDALAAVHSAIDTLTARVAEARAGASQQAGATLEQAEQLVDRHPVATLLTAFGVGFLLAKLFSKN
jgi:ElaB/YqjD/DUF883 family membrane-anchored ribosome-binding protein